MVRGKRKGVCVMAQVRGESSLCVERREGGTFGVRWCGCGKGVRLWAECG